MEIVVNIIIGLLAVGIPLIILIASANRNNKPIIVNVSSTPCVIHLKDGSKHESSVNGNGEVYLSLSSCDLIKKVWYKSRVAKIESKLYGILKVQND